MKGANKQIGWSQEAILLQRISVQLSFISGLAGSIGGGGSVIKPLETNVTDATAWNNGSGNRPTNTAFGEFAFANNTTGSENSAFGYSNLYSNIIGDQNTTSGYYTGLTNEGVQNTVLGAGSLFANQNTSYNTGIGVYVFTGETPIPTGNYNTALGMYVLNSLTTGNGNTGIGGLAFQSRANTSFTGSYNIGLGYQSLRNLSSGNNNIGILIEFQDGVQTGHRNINIDPRNKPMLASANNDNVVIAGLDATLAAADGQVVIGTGASNTRRLDFSSAGAMTIALAQNNGNGAYAEKAILIDAVSDADGMSKIKTIDYVDENATAALLTKANLDAAYPAASIGFRVTCRAIASTPKIYTKVSTTAWCSESITNVA